MEAKKEENAVELYGKKYLEENQAVGMRRIDPSDIRPPSMLLIQQLSDLSQLVDKNGKTPKTGQFFHTGRFEIFDTFDCYIIFAAKSKYIDKNKPEKGEQDQYKAVGVMVDDLSYFGITFRSSSLYTLSSLFTASVSEKRPMYSIKLHFETKELSDKEGHHWKVPVMRIAGSETSSEKLALLERIALKFDKNPEKVEQEEEEEFEETADKIFNKN